MKILSPLFILGLLLNTFTSFGQYDVLFNVLPASNTGTADGQITLSFTEDLSPYEFTWTGPSVSSSTANNQNQYDLLAGEYCITVSNADDCLGEGCVFVSNCAISNDGISLNASVPCEIGLIDLSATGGIFPYTYHWEYLAIDGTGISSETSDTEDLLALHPGNYCVTVTDACGATANTCYETFNNISITLATSTSICHGDGLGSLDITVTGAYGAIEYLWDNGANTEDLVNLDAAGTYCLTVKDSRNCSATACFVVEESFTVDIIVGTTCGGNPTGYIEVIPPYWDDTWNFEWDFPADIPFDPIQINTTVGIVLNQASAGVYGLTITDGFGCTLEEEIVVETNNETPIITNTQINNACGTNSDGSIELFFNGTPMAYTIAWNNGENTPTIGNLGPGEYCVTVSNVTTGCSDSECYSIVATPELLIMAEEEKSCPDQSTGSIALSVSGGTPPYVYLWSTGSRNETISNVLAGFYSVTVTDANACSRVEYFNLAAYSRMNLDLSVTNVCFGGDGAVDMAISGGTPPYTYSWTGGSSNQNLVNMEPGEYCVLVTDAKGCRNSDCVIIDYQLELQENITDACVGQYVTEEGTISVLPSNGTPPFTFAWSTGENTPVVQNLLPGEYFVTVTDALGCISIASYVVGNYVYPTIAWSKSSELIQNHGSCTEVETCENGAIGVSPYELPVTFFSTGDYENPCTGGMITCPFDPTGGIEVFNGSAAWRESLEQHESGLCWTRVTCYFHNFNGLGWKMPVTTVGLHPCDINLIPNSIDYAFAADSSQLYYYISGQTENREQAFIHKLDADHNIIWMQLLNGSDVTHTDMAVDQNGAIYTTGSFYGMTIDTLGNELKALGAKDLFIHKYHQGGETLWSKTVTSDGFIQPKGLAIDEANNIIIMGSFSGVANYGDITISSEEEDVFVVKVDGNGQLIWFKRFGGLGNDKSLDLAVDQQNNIYLVGSFSESIDFGNGNAMVPTNHQQGLFLTKLSEDGVYEWMQTGGIKETLAADAKLVLDVMGNIFWAGEFHESLILNAQTGNPTTLAAENFNRELFLTKYTSNGERLWLNHYGKTTDPINVAAIAYNPNIDNFVLSGTFQGVALFDDYTLESTGQEDLFLLEVNQAGVITRLKQEGAQNTEITTDLVITPNNIATYTGYFWDQSLIEGQTKTGSVDLPTMFLADFYLEEENATPPESAVRDHAKHTIWPQHISVTPNPFTDNLNIHFYTATKELMNIRVFDFLGKEIFSRSQVFDIGQHTTQVRLNAILPDGIYLLRIEGAQGSSFTEKILQTNH